VFKIDLNTTCEPRFAETPGSVTNLLTSFLVEDNVLTWGRRCEFFNTHSNDCEAFYRIAPKHIPNRMDFQNIERRNLTVDLLIFLNAC
jgi:hypothetical protein